MDFFRLQSQIGRISLVAVSVYTASAVVIVFFDVTVVSQNSSLMTFFDLIGGMRLVKEFLGPTHMLRLLNVKVVLVLILCVSALGSIFWLNRHWLEQEVADWTAIEPKLAIVATSILMLWALFGPITLCLKGGTSSRCGEPVHLFMFWVQLGVGGFLAWGASFITEYFWHVRRLSAPN